MFDFIRWVSSHLQDTVAAPSVEASRNLVVQSASTIIASGKYHYGRSRASGYLNDDVMDCSEFVQQAFVRAGFAMPAYSSHEFARHLTPVLGTPRAGDVVYWKSGHVGIVEDPVKGTFLGAQSSGLARASYSSGWWAKHGRVAFYRYASFAN